MLNVILLCVVMLNVILLCVVMLNVVMLNVILLNVFLLSVIILSVFTLNVIMLDVIMLNVIMLSVILLNVVAPTIRHYEETQQPRLRDEILRIVLFENRIELKFYEFFFNFDFLFLGFVLKEATQKTFSCKTGQFYKSFLSVIYKFS
jgi:hypothetical protein